MSMVVGETTGRYEPDSKYGKPKQSRETTKSHFKLEWEEGTLRLDERLAAWKIEPTPEDRPAGVARKDMRPIHSSDPTIFQHAEYPPATSRPSTASRISDTNKYFIQAVEGIAIDAGVAGDTARTLAIHHVFGSKMKRPPTAPGNIVSGKYQPAKPPPTPRGRAPPAPLERVRALRVARRRARCRAATACRRRRSCSAASPSTLCVRISGTHR